MKYLILLLLLGGGYYAYLEYKKPSSQRPYGDYDLNSLAQKPIPRDVMLDGDKFYAKDAICSEKSFQNFSGKSLAACQAYVEQNHDHCKAEALPYIPELVHSLPDMEMFAKPYLNCVLPRQV